MNKKLAGEPFGRVPRHTGADLVRGGMLALVVLFSTGVPGGIALGGFTNINPRADANFRTVIGETRVLPEDLPATYGKLRQAWHEIE